MRFYPNLSQEDLKLTLIHPGDVILPELSPRLGKYAQRKLEERGVEVMAHARVASYDGSQIELASGGTIPARTLIWTAGTMPNPLISTLPCAVERGRVKVTAELAVPDWPGVWALGDCALVPGSQHGKFCPPTAQHALRQGKVAAPEYHRVCRWRRIPEVQLQDHRPARNYRAPGRRRQRIWCERFRVRGLVDVAHNLLEQAAAMGKEDPCGPRLDSRSSLLERSVPVHRCAPGTQDEQRRASAFAGTFASPKCGSGASTRRFHNGLKFLIIWMLFAR